MRIFPTVISWLPVRLRVKASLVVKTSLAKSLSFSSVKDSEHRPSSRWLYLPVSLSCNTAYAPSESLWSTGKSFANPPCTVNTNSFFLNSGCVDGLDT